MSNSQQSENFWENAPIIHQYTRADALADGTIIDVSTLANEVGINFPVAVTSTVWNGYINPSPMPLCQDRTGRLWDVFSVFKHYAKQCEGDIISFPVLFIMKQRQRRQIWLKALIAPGDHGEPVIIIMLPNED